MRDVSGDAVEWIVGVDAMTTERPADDMDALLAWLKEQALEAHLLFHCRPCTPKKCEFFDECYVNPSLGEGMCAQEVIFLYSKRVIAKIENSRINQRPHVPQGWDEV